MNRVSSHKKKPSKSGLFSQLDDFYQDNINRNAAGDGQQNAVVNEDIVDHEFSVNNTGSNLTTNENLMNMKFLEICFNEKIDSELSNVVDTVEKWIQNANLTAIDCWITPRIELAVRFLNASSGRDAPNVTAYLERGERIKFTASLENVSGSNNTLHVLNVNDETWNNFQDEVSELSSQEHILTGNDALVTWWHDKQPKPIKFLSFLQDIFLHRMTHHHTNIRTYQHKYHKTTI